MLFMANHGAQHSLEASYTVASYRKSNRHLTIDGETKPLFEWAAVSGVSRQVIEGRLDRDWTAEDAVFLEPRKYRGNSDIHRTRSAEETPQ
jgi:hypothetical protein